MLVALPIALRHDCLPSSIVSPHIAVYTRPNSTPDIIDTALELENGSTAVAAASVMEHALQDHDVPKRLTRSPENEPPIAATPIKPQNRSDWFSLKPAWDSAIDRPYVQ